MVEQCTILMMLILQFDEKIIMCELLGSKKRFAVSRYMCLKKKKKNGFKGKSFDCKSFDSKASIEQMFDLTLELPRRCPF